MNSILKKLKQQLKTTLADPFWRSVGNLFSGTVIGQALPILIFPLLTRIYPKTIFDVYFIYSSLILLTQIIANLQYHFALLLPKKESDARALLFINTAISFIVSLGLLLIIFIAQPLLRHLVENDNLLKWIWFIPVSTLFLGLSETYMYYLNRLQRYTYMTYGRISKGLLLVAGQSIFGLAGYTADGLLWGLVIGQGVSTLLLLFLIIKSDPSCFVFSRSDLAILARRYKDMPLYNTVISFINNLSSQLPVFLLTRYYGAGTSGDFGMANKIVNTPMGMISQSVSQVFYRETSEIMHTGRNLKTFVHRMYRNMFRMAIVPFSLVLFTAPWLFEFVFSEAYTSTGYMAQVLIPFYFLSFINNPMTGLLTMLNRQKWGAFYQLTLLVARAAAIGAGILFFDNVLITIGLFSLTGVVFNIWLYFYLIRLADNPTSNYHI
ncbi:MAG: oligosaccharide flippase family protein [Salinivirgaceae bacterium]